MRWMFIFLIGLSLISFTSAVTCYNGMSGAGTLASPCLVTNWTSLNATRLNLTAYYRLSNDLNSMARQGSRAHFF